ncbi:MAG: peptide MFS transporter [Sphingomonadaceae bacterium]|nr:peptide MFS transporter [Sphingomonadaceae bacterium]
MATIPAAADAATWFGHPRQLARLFSTELWERFGFYGLRALLVLYLTKHFVFGDRVAGGMYGAMLSMTYLTPFIGGIMADRFLGSKRAVKFGAIIMAVGYFVLCFGGEAAKPTATFDGVTHAVSIEQHGGVEQRFVVASGQRLLIHGNDDGSVALMNGGTTVRTLAKDAFTGDATRSPLYVAIMLAALSAIVVGNGFFKPNISTMVGALYAPGDRRRDAGFTIFYMGINLGSLGSQLLCPVLADTFGWWAGFGLAAAGMLVAWSLIQFDGGRLAGYGEPPASAATKDRAPLIYVLAVLATALPWLLFSNTITATAAPAGAGIVAYLLALPILGKLLFATFLIGVPAILVWSWRAGSRTEFEMMLAAMILIVFNVTFWTLFEQAGSSLTLFADRNTDLSIFGLFTITAGQTQFFNAIFIVLLAPVFAAMWAALARRGAEPGIPVKFAIALIGVGAGFLFLVWGTHYAGPDFKVAIWWLAGLYLIHSMAELCISPVGLSMITKLSIARVVGMMMGMWFLSISVAEYVGGIVAQGASVDTVGGQVTNLKLSLDTYAGVFQTIGFWAVVIGGILLAGSFLLKRLMHGVD